MKINGNDKIMSDYYIGLDVGTNSVGWAVSSKDYDLLKFKGNVMWGSHLFEEAQDASGRRGSRTARRLADRKKQRLNLLELLFAEEIGKVDPLFFYRLGESSLFEEDKEKAKTKYSLFSDKDYNDKTYMKQYPTVYHLRSELIRSQDPHDIRLVFLAIHHIIKSRGHFLFDMDAEGDYKDINTILDEMVALLSDQFDAVMTFADKSAFVGILLREDLNVTNKKKTIKELIQISGDDAAVNVTVLAYALVGATVKLSDLFNDESLKNAEQKSLCLRGDLDDNYDQYVDAVGDRIELISAMKSVFDAARLSQILGDSKYISDAKVKQFYENKKDLATLKKYVRQYEPDKYDYIFKEKKNSLDNFAAYSRRTINSGEYKKVSQDNLCKFLKKELASMKSVPEYKDLYAKIEDASLLPRLKGSDNSVIPNQLHYRELVKILDNAAGYLPFLSSTDSDGISVKDKILKIFSFRIPYYVGPLNKKSPNAWVERTDEKIAPWNFEKVVDTTRSAEKFIENLIGRCTYTKEKVIPKDSLLYSEFMVLNEINPICINGKQIPVSVKQKIFNDLFVNSRSKVTKKSIKQYLIKEGLVKETDEISGVDDVVKSKLKSYHDFEKILKKTHDTDMVENIIKNILIFGDDKKMLKSWLKSSCKALDENDIAYVLRLKYKDWGRFSKEFLTQIYTPDENGEARSIIDMLRSTNNNLMKLLSSNYNFADEAEHYRNEHFGITGSLKEQIEEMYVPPMIKRSIWQTLKIVDEIVDIEKAAPKKIFIEVARGTKEDLKGKRTVSRKERLLALYKECKKESDEVYESLKAEDENHLRHDALYLYYTQFGKCMYSGEDIDITKIDTDFDVDHIYPQSKVKDDSLDNRVLVKRSLNIEKGNEYPINPNMQNKMRNFWLGLKQKGLISEEKYKRLIRTTCLTDDELYAFVNRQLVETRQSTKALAQLLKELYPQTKLVYSKAGNVSDFRNDFDMLKCRDINDLHHTKDAYLNIVVGNVLDTKFTQAFFKNINGKSCNPKTVFNYDVAGAWEKEKTIIKVKSVMSKNNVLVTRMPHEAKGQLFDVQIMPKGKGQLPVKEGKDINKYGGYNKVAGAYFFAVEHVNKNNSIRTIEPVYIYKKALYEKDPIAYCTEVLGLIEPKIICKRILIDALLEINEKKVYITGRSGSSFVCKHAYQFSVDYESEMYIKAIAKYIGKCTEAKAELKVTSFDRISVDENIKLYDLFLSKFQKPVYARLFSKVSTDCVNGKERFVNMSLYDQCKVLMEILKFFKCDRTTSDITSIGGKGQAGVISVSGNITNNSFTYLIHQSVTGLFEVRTNLLK